MDSVVVYIEAIPYLIHLCMEYNLAVS